MDISSDIHIESAKLQKEIANHLGVKPESLVFDYQLVDSVKTKLNLITINPRHNQSFLFESTVGIDRIDALKKMLEFVKSYKDKYNSYTIQWRSKGDNELHTSYFSAQNIVDAMEKLYFGRDMNTLIVYSVVLNPVS